MYVPTKPTAAKARLISAAGTLVVLLDVSLALNLGSCQRRCNSAVHTDARRDFISSSLVTWPLGLSCSFSPPLCVFLPQESAPEAARGHEPVKQEEVDVVNGATRLPRREGAGVRIGTCEPIRQ